MDEKITEYYKKWLKFKDFVRQQMRGLNLLEVETPTLVEGPAFEAQLECFSTQLNVGGHQQKFYLPTSPEIHLKKLLAAKFENIFEIKTCFRNGELGPHHQPEFSMLEWYRNSENINVLIEDIECLFSALNKNKWLQLQEPKIKKLSLSKLFQQELGFVLTPHTSPEDLLALARDLKLNVNGKESRIELFNWIFVDQLEAKIPHEVPTIIYNYPPWAVTLARVNKEGWAERFELYFRGLELANAFGELTDYQEHLLRWQEIQDLRVQQNLESLGKDDEFFTAIKNGLPKSVGIAMGLERLFMACQNLHDIRDFKIFGKSITQLIY